MRGYRQATLQRRAFPLAAGDRPGIKELWRLHTSSLIAILEQGALASFRMAQSRLDSTLWLDALRLFPEFSERLMRVDPAAMLERTLAAGVFEEYGLSAFEETLERNNITIQYHQYGHSNIHLTFPSIVVSDKIHAIVIGGDGKVQKHELRLPNKSDVLAIVAAGDDLAVNYRDEKYQVRFFWVSDPAQHYETTGYWHFSMPRHEPRRYWKMEASSWVKRPFERATSRCRSRAPTFMTESDSVRQPGLRPSSK